MIVDTTGDKVNESWLLLIKKTVEKPSLKIRKYRAISIPKIIVKIYIGFVIQFV